MTTHPVRIGISGWRYPPWRGVFYPPKLPQRRELEYASRRFTSIEINGSFYSLQQPSSFLRWAAETPEEFEFSVKGPRFITHMLRLRRARVPLANFFASGVLALGTKLGPILWQLPERQGYDADQLAEFFSELPRSTRAALELAREHDAKVEGRTWFPETVPEPVDPSNPSTSSGASSGSVSPEPVAEPVEGVEGPAPVPDRAIEHVLEVRSREFADNAEFVDLLRHHRIGLVVADTAGRWPYLDAITAPVVYVRLHGDTELYVSGYTEQALAVWADRVRQWREQAGVYVYFDNDVKVQAPFDAQRLADLLGVEPAG